MTSRIRVFLVDDHPLVRDWLKNLLETEPDMDVIGEADEPHSAIAAMCADPPDVAIIDLSLKRGSGLDVIKALQARAPRIRSLVLSMHESISDVERALRAGARGYVMKSESSNQIVPAIRCVQAGRIYATPEVFSRLTERMTGLPATGIRQPADMLSDREMHVFRRIGEGHTTRRIAEELNVSQKTVQTYCARIKEKFGLDDGAELALAAIRWRELEKF
jgi:DNA-binding NarL/FixJ family response regulator